MATAEEIKAMTFTSCTFRADGQAEVRLDRMVDGVMRPFRYCLAPGDALTGLHREVAAACTAKWTPAVVSAYKAARDAAAARMR